MKNKYLLILITCFLLTAVSHLSAFSLGGRELVRSGSGARTKALIGTVYYASLYIPAEYIGKGGKAVIEADEPMSIVIRITSSLITKERFMDAVRDGFKNAEKSGYKSPNQDRFLKTYEGLTFAVGDVFSINYTPKGGSNVVYTPKATGKSKSLGSVQGLDLKKSVFAIWLGPVCVQESLKNGMLGK
jgi:hypothetical protein